MGWDAEMEPASDGLDSQRELVAALLTHLRGRHACVQVFETHISWVLVAGKHAWKIKKALALGFLDYSTLASRRFHCLEELRLNRRTAPDLYLGVVPIAGSPKHPDPGGAGEPIEYAVHMRAFEQSALWSARLTAGSLTPAEVDQLACELARFHTGAARAPDDEELGTPQVQHLTANENLDTIAALVRAETDREAIATLRTWQESQRSRLDAVFVERKARGRVRECHGDLHCGNILTLEGRVQAFDCIEFNPRMRWIDVISDLAFACMDLAFRGRIDFSWRLLNGYLDETGDHGGLGVLRYYLVHRALVRCKVELLLSRQAGDAAEAQAAYMQASRYLALALRTAQAVRPMIVIMHGLSGSGKSTFAARLAEAAGMVRVRSDIERKRLHVMPSDQPGVPAMYTEDKVNAVYAHLAQIAHAAASAGHPIIIDAAFLARARRRQFEDLAAQLGARFLIVDMQAREVTLRARLVERMRRGGDPSDADIAVLERQLATHEPLDAAEIRHAVCVDVDSGDAANALAQLCRLIQSGGHHE